jgi:hypothetical protein
MLVAQGISYCIQGSFRSAGPIISVYPLQIGMQWLERISGAEREARWCVQLFERIVEGGNPFRDPEPEVQNEWRRREKGHATSFQLCLSRYGDACLRLES